MQRMLVGLLVALTAVVGVLAAELVGFDASDVQTELRPADGCDVSSRASTYDENVEVVF